MKKTFGIWSEGFAATGESGGAMFHGKGRGKTFKEAVLNFCSKNPGFSEHLDLELLTYWGCKLYSDEEEARKSFG